MGALASTAITAAATLLTALLTALPALTHRTRKIQRRQAAQIDALEAWAYDARRAVRVHNDALPRGADPLSLPPLPDWMIHAADEE